MTRDPKIGSGLTTPRQCRELDPHTSSFRYHRVPVFETGRNNFEPVPASCNAALYLQPICALRVCSGLIPRHNFFILC